MKLTFQFIILPLLLLASFTDAEGSVYDYLIEDALVYDGVSPHGIRQDVAISWDSIAAVGDLDSADAANVIDGRGLVLAPGFIDTHTHSDFNAFVYPDLPNKLMQGVTTEIVGNCGMSAAPVEGSMKQKIHGIWAREGVKLPNEIPWQSFREYQNESIDVEMLTNVVSLVGHGNLRTWVMGDKTEPARGGYLKSMRLKLAEAMQQGAYGISFGLVYLPGTFADSEEIIELCRVVRDFDGMCAFHMRNEGSGLIESIQEVINVGEKTGVRLQISHLKAAGQSNWGKITEALQLIQNARNRGIFIQADVYPYTASFAELGVLLPDEIFERKDRKQLFKDSTQRESLLEQLKAHYGSEKDWKKVVVASIPDETFTEYEGQSIDAISKKEGKAPEEVLIDLLADTNFKVSAFSFSQSDEVVDEVIQKPFVTIGSDSIADGSGKPHPRAYGTFPKILSDYVRDDAAFSIGEAIRKMTSVPAEHFRIKDRGRILPGFMADLVLFDAEMIDDLATYEDSDALSHGVEWVFVNGEPVIREGQFTEGKFGRFLLLNS